MKTSSITVNIRVQHYMLAAGLQTCLSVNFVSVCIYVTPHQKHNIKSNTGFLLIQKFLIMFSSAGSLFSLFIDGLDASSSSKNVYFPFISINLRGVIALTRNE